LNLAFILTDSFVTPFETAQILATSIDKPGWIPVLTDQRICESDLSSLTRARFERLGEAEAGGDPNAAIRDWIEQRPDDVADLVSRHVGLWNETVLANAGKKFAMVLHVEGLLLYPVLLLGAAPTQMVSLHIPRAHPIHVRLFPDRPPLLSVGDETYWTSVPSSIFGQYN
jgi:hypothetical protein